MGTDGRRQRVEINAKSQRRKDAGKTGLTTEIAKITKGNVDKPASGNGETPEKSEFCQKVRGINVRRMVGFIHLTLIPLT